MVAIGLSDSFPVSPTLYLHLQKKGKTGNESNSPIGQYAYECDKAECLQNGTAITASADASQISAAD